MQYTRQTLTTKISNSRNGHELERLSMVLDALHSEGADVDANGMPTFVFELVSRMFIGVEAADVSNDYTIIDGLIGTQRVALPIDVIQLINKSRLQSKKIQYRTGSVDGEDCSSRRASRGGFNYSFGRGRGGWNSGYGNRAGAGAGGGNTAGNYQSKGSGNFGTRGRVTFNNTPTVFGSSSGGTATGSATNRS